MDTDIDPAQADPTPAVAPAPQSAIPVADLSGALVDAYRQITAGQRQQAPLDPLDAMSENDRQALRDEFLVDPLAAARKVSNMGATAERARLMQQALPLIQTSANTIVELYKTRKQRSDTYFAKIEPLFDKLMVGVDITPLVNMNEATRNNELDMRWKMARADVLEVEMKRQKPEPTLLATGGGNNGGGGSSLEDDPWLANMKREYNLSDDQIKDILGA